MTPWKFWRRHLACANSRFLLRKAAPCSTFGS
jgi:hypothetical protein